MAGLTGNTPVGFRAPAADFPSFGDPIVFEPAPSLEPDAIDLYWAVVFKAARPIVLAASLLAVCATWWDTEDALFAWRSFLLDALFVVSCLLSFLPKLNTPQHWDFLVLCALLAHHISWTSCMLLEPNEFCAVLGVEDPAFFFVRFVGSALTMLLACGFPWFVVVVSIAAILLPIRDEARTTFEEVWAHRHRIAFHVLGISSLVALRFRIHRRMRNAAMNAAKQAQDAEPRRKQNSDADRPSAVLQRAIAMAAGDGSRAAASGVANGSSDSAVSVVLLDGTLVESLSQDEVNGITLRGLMVRLEASLLDAGAHRLSLVHGVHHVWHATSDEDADQLLKDRLRLNADGAGGESGQPGPCILTCVMCCNDSTVEATCDGSEPETWSTAFGSTNSFGVTWTVIRR